MGRHGHRRLDGAAERIRLCTAPRHARFRKATISLRHWLSRRCERVLQRPLKTSVLDERNKQVQLVDGTPERDVQLQCALHGTVRAWRVCAHRSLERNPKPDHPSLWDKASGAPRPFINYTDGNATKYHIRARMHPLQAEAISSYMHNARRAARLHRSCDAR